MGGRGYCGNSLQSFQLKLLKQSVNLYLLFKNGLLEKAKATEHN